MLTPTRILELYEQCQSRTEIEDALEFGRAVEAEAARDAMDTLVAVLNAIGYTEEFAAAHPDLKVSEGVKLFLAASAPTLGAPTAPAQSCTCIGGLGHTRSCPMFDESMVRYEPFGPTAPAQMEPVTYRYIVVGYGETDYPQAELIATRDKLLDAALGMMYTKPSDADADMREAYRKDLDDEDEWSEGIWRTEFEIGGIVIYDTGAAAVAKAVMTEAEIESLAHRQAYIYKHGSDSIEFIFNRHCLLNFARALIGTKGE